MANNITNDSPPPLCKNKGCNKCLRCTNLKVWQGNYHATTDDLLSRSNHQGCCRPEVDGVDPSLPPSSTPALFPAGHPLHTPYQQTQQNTHANLDASPNVKVNQTQTPAWMWVPHHVHVHDARHNTSTSSLLSMGSRGLSNQERACSLDRVVWNHYL